MLFLSFLIALPYEQTPLAFANTIIISLMSDICINDFVNFLFTNVIPHILLTTAHSVAKSRYQSGLGTTSHFNKALLNSNSISVHIARFSEEIFSAK